MLSIVLRLRQETKEKDVLPETGKKNSSNGKKVDDYCFVPPPPRSVKQVFYYH